MSLPDDEVRDLLATVEEAQRTLRAAERRLQWHATADRPASPDRLASSGPEPFDACPDGGRCWHGCPTIEGPPEGKGLPCWRVAHAAPIGSDDWPEHVKDRHAHAAEVRETPTDWVFTKMDADAIAEAYDGITGPGLSIVPSALAGAMNVVAVRRWKGPRPTPTPEEA